MGARPVVLRFVAAAALALWLGASLPVIGVVGGASAAAAAAACLPPADLGVAIASGEVVLVGVVDAVENNGRWATVRVEERWHGAEAVGGTVRVRGGPEPGTATSSDRTFAAGVRYLFVAGAGNGFLVDNLCTVTQPWSPDLAQYRPRGVDPVADRPPAAPAFSLPPDLVPVIALFAALAVAVAAYRVILVSRRRPPDWMR